MNKLVLNKLNSLILNKPKYINSTANAVKSTKNL